MAGDAKRLRLLLAPAVVIAGLLVSVSAHAQQATVVNFELCGNLGPEITVTNPVSDSVTSTSIIQISGSAVRTTQIEVSLNGVYDQSIAIGQQNPSFSTTLELVKGTNSIMLRGYYSCNQLSQNTNVVVTYEPNTSSSNGAEISTQSAVSGSESFPTISNPDTAPILNSDLSLPERVKENLGLGADINDSIVRPAGSWAAVALSVGSTFVALSPFFITTKIFEYLGIQQPQSFGRGKKLVIRILFGIIAALLAVLVQA